MERPILSIEITNKYKIILQTTYYLLFVIILTNIMEWYVNKEILQEFIVKYKMLFLAVFSIIMVWGSTYLRKHPQHFNYRKPITEINAKAEYTKSTHAIILLIFFALLSFTVISIVHLLQKTPANSTNWQYYPIVVALGIIYFIILFFKAIQIDNKLQN